jgi:hypothetical protein
VRLGVLLLALAAVVVAGGGVAWVVHGRSRHPGAPDVRAYARSGFVRSADRAYAAWFDGQFAALGRAASWLRPAGQSVLDVCQALPSGGAGYGGATSWSLSCQRAQAGYYAYRGDGAARVAQLERTLTRIGWGGFTFTPGLAATAGQPATPAVLQAGYIASQTAPAGKAGLIISWLSPAQTRAVRGYVRLPVVRATAYVDPIRVVPPDLGLISRAAAQAEGNLVVVELVAEYTKPGG